jgi:hypothetical protein
MIWSVCRVAPLLLLIVVKSWTAATAPMAGGEEQFYPPVRAKFQALEQIELSDTSKAYLGTLCFIAGYLLCLFCLCITISACCIRRATWNQYLKIVAFAAVVGSLGCWFIHTAFYLAL